MITNISVAEGHSADANLVILSDKKHLDWASSLLNQSEISFLNRSIDSDLPHVFIPQESRVIIVCFLKNSKSEDQFREDNRVAGNDILNVLGHYKIREVYILDEHPRKCALDFAEGMVLGNYQFLKYFTDRGDRENSLKEIYLQKTVNKETDIQQLEAVLKGTCLARDLVNEPHSHQSATTLSESIIRIGEETGFQVEVFDRDKISSLKMGGILAVNKGSFTPPTFNILEWNPPHANNEKPIILVGKGIVYDTGGLSLKPTPNSMDKMKSDMAGAATVIGTLAAVALAKLPLHIIGLIPATDNRPGNDAVAPGDVITMYDGTTVEVMNTDAEGRLVLADGLSFAKKYDPLLVLDFATLTGAAARACGKEGICFMGSASEEIKNNFKKSGFAVHERLIEFPLWKEYGEQLKSNIADLKNLGSGSAGMITAGKFLEHFTAFPWLHFDIAGTAFLKSADHYRTKEGTGTGVRLLFNFLSTLK